MSRIGKQPIIIPKEVEVEVANNQVLVKGPKGKLSFSYHYDVQVLLSDNDGEKILTVERRNSSKQARALWGTTRALIQNMIQGVTEGFVKVLELHGVGYKMALQGNKLVLNLGFSHPVEKEVPSSLKVEIEGDKMKISGIDKQEVGQFAAMIRALRPVEPYKGKGFRYEGEEFIKKEGKKAVGSE